MNELKDKLEAVNGLSSVHSHIFNVFDKTLKRFDVLVAGHVLSVSGYEIPVDAAKEDEGVWLEKRTHNGYERVTVYTCCGHGDGYRVVRVSRKVRAVTP